MNFPGPYYRKPDPERWQGRQDSLKGERFFQHVMFHDLIHLPSVEILTGKTAFIGFCSDIGVRRNLGNPGAAQGPIVLRQQLAKLALHHSNDYIDLGDIDCHDDNLEQAQQDFAKLIDYCHQNQVKTVAFGGGHEIALAHYRGLAAHYPNIGIINFDAHFDLRPLLPNQQGSSGTPFRQIADFCQQQQRSFNYCCLGIQPSGNTASLFQTATELNVSYLSAQAIHQLSLPAQIEFLNQFLDQHSVIYLTLCLDVLAEAYAPGVSAPQPLGLTPWQIIPLLKYIIQSGKVVSLDIAELSPVRDFDNKTSRLAAFILAELLELY